MSTALQFQLRPVGPWRIGAGARAETGRIFPSDALYGAVCSAMGSLGWLDEWLDATARAEGDPAVRISSLFPAFQGDLLAPPPANLWPVPGAARSRAATLIPVRLIAALATGKAFSDDSWELEGDSHCLLKRGSRLNAGLFCSALRSHAAVDRLGDGVEVHHSACIEFHGDCRLWGIAQFADPAGPWQSRIEACLRLLADTGLGGGRSKGWGGFVIERVSKGDTRSLLFGHNNELAAATSAEPSETGHWLLSLYNPAPADGIDWSRGSYRVFDRGGRVESRAGWGAEKKELRMIGEGALLASTAVPRGRAADVAPDGFGHPVYRAGFAVTTELPLKVSA
ncbi:MAG: hypothetical protein R2729_07020 [Bryobacteraceae bacterium]